MKKMAYAVSLALGVGIAGSAGAATTTSITIDPDGGGALGSLNVGALEWGTASGLAVGANGASAPGTLSQFYAHSYLNAFTNTSGIGVNPGGALNSTIEWTYVTGFLEQVVSNNPVGNLQFATVAGGNNFFEIWFHSQPNADPLVGSGFNDGIRILSGTILPSFPVANSNFAVSAIPAAGANAPLDQFLNDDYPAIESVTGTGGGQLAVEVANFNALFFQGIAVGDILQLAFDTQQNLPFRQIDPSGCFWTGAAYTPGAGNALCGANTLGTINGLGPNTEIQTDSSTSFLITRVPEPGSLMLLGIGLLGLGGAIRRSRAA